MEEKRTGGRQDVAAIAAAADFENAFRAHFAPVYRFIARRVGAELAEVFATALASKTTIRPLGGEAPHRFAYPAHASGSSSRRTSPARHPADQGP
jgi:hypothetical protein